MPLSTFAKKPKHDLALTEPVSDLTHAVHAFALAVELRKRPSPHPLRLIPRDFLLQEAHDLAHTSQPSTTYTQMEAA